MSVPPTKFTPRTNHTIPQLRNESAQPLSRGMKGRKNFTGTSYALPKSFGNAVQSVSHRRGSVAESPAGMRECRPECVGKDVVRHSATLRDAFGFIEDPMNAEVNSALTVFFFCLRQ